MEPCNDAARFAWACSVFGLQPGAAPQEVRAAILSHLDDANFVPPWGWRQAIWLLSDPRSPQAWPESGYDAFHEALENNLAEDVDQFATRFFSLPRGPRRARWAQLLEQAATFPRLRARLAAFQPGLDAESGTPDAKNQQESVLVERIRRLFVLKPGAQEAQRRQWLATMTGDWQPVVRKVRSKYPKLAQLEGDFLSALGSNKNGAAAVKPSAAIAGNSNLAASFLTAPRFSSAGPTPVRTRAGASSGSSSGWRGWPVVAFIVFLRIMASLNSPSTYTPPNIPNPRSFDDGPQRYRDTIRNREGTPGGTLQPWIPDGDQSPGIPGGFPTPGMRGGNPRPGMPGNPTPWTPDENPIPGTPGGPTPRNAFGGNGEANPARRFENQSPLSRPPPPSGTIDGNSSRPAFPDRDEEGSP
jgi:hypothetical protein